MRQGFRIGGIGIVAVIVVAVLTGMLAESVRQSQVPKPTPRPAAVAATSRPVATAASRPTNTPKPTSSPTPIPEPQAPIKVDGKGTMNSPPIDLQRGHYLVKWFAQADTPAGCYHNVEMVAVSGKGRPETVVNSMLRGEPQAGETRFYNVAAGQYYLRANSGCEWSVTIEPTNVMPSPPTPPSPAARIRASW